MEQMVVDNRYALVRVLGSGGMAKVYLAHDEVLGRDVALKMLRGAYAEDEEFVERFKREAQAAARLSHPNIVAVYDRGRAEDGSYYIAMEYVPGGTLKERIVRDGALSPGISAGVAEQIADALSAAHDQGVVHRDIKPQNALVTRSGDIKVTDFGIARAAASPSVTATSVVLGTAAYMSPEQAQGKVVGPQSDLYSLGVVLYEMLTGSLPFEAENPVVVSMQHVNEPAPSPRSANPEVPEALDAITMRLLAKDPEDRYPSAAALANDLDRLQSGLAPTVVDAEKTTLMAAPLAPMPQDTARTSKTAVVPPTSTSRPVDSRPRDENRRGGGLLRLLAPLLVGVALLAGIVYALTAGDNPDTTGSDSEQPAVEAPGVEVPDVRGQTEDAATQALQAAGLEVEVELEESTWDQFDEVVDQSPEPGERLEENGTVNLTVGDGPAVVVVPDLVLASEAAETLDFEGLVLGSVQEVPSETVPAGQVIETNPTEGTEVGRDTIVDLIVSSGPAPVGVPSQPSDGGAVQGEQPQDQGVLPQDQGGDGGGNGIPGLNGNIPGLGNGGRGESEGNGDGGNGDEGNGGEGNSE